MSLYDTYARFPKLKIEPHEAKKFAELSEYSGTIPTGVTPGKRWRRHDGVYAMDDLPPVWLICEYGPEVDEQCAILRYRPLIRMPALSDRMVVVEVNERLNEGFAEWCEDTFGYQPKANVLTIHALPSHKVRMVLTFKKAGDAIACKMWL